MDLVIVAAAVLIFAVAMYVVLDGFDLGVGILFPFAPGDEARETMIAAVSPIWDGNETWLVLGGITLFSAFPLAYSVLLPSLYLGLMAFLAALIFRGVVFEFRPRSRRKRRWDWAFFAGSTGAAFAQGLVLGSFVEGFDLEDGVYVGGPFGWLTPFSLVTGVALVSGYALLGATWLIMKSDGVLQAWCYRVARPLAAVLIGFILLVSLWTPLAEAEIARRWFSWPNLLYLSPVPAITAAAAWRLWRALSLHREREPFPLSAGLFMLAYLGFAISIWPFIVPRHISLWEAASPPESLSFILTGVLLLVPLVLAYTAHTYYVFRGKVRADNGYR